ncbi:MAG: metallophosphoesterase family protein [Anaerolineales bacterium]
MKIAALGDIHGNYHALIRVLEDLENWKPDQVLVLGDLINRGPRSKDCLDLIQEKARNPHWQLIKGNHEGYVLNFRDPAYSRSGHDYQLRKVILWTFQTLTEQDIAEISRLPEEITVHLPDPAPLKAAHASTAGDRIGIYPTTPSADLPGLTPADAGAFVVGHTHQPLIRNFQGTTIVNAGSVGLPFDGDTRPSYARLTYHNGEWQAEIIRLEYDREAAEEDFFSFGFIPEGGPLAELILVELQLGWPQLGKWFKRFEQPFRQDQISLQDAVYEFLKNPNIETRNSGNRGMIA